MFSSSIRKHAEGSFSKHRASKSKSHKKNPSFRDSSKKMELLAAQAQASSPQSNQTSPTLGSAIITIAVGREQRLFAAHEDVLSHSPFFSDFLRGQFFQSTNKRIDLPDEEPEVFSSILEYLYKGDYAPRMTYDKKRHSWALEDDGVNEAVVNTAVGPVLKATVLYCQADRYGLDELKKICLKKQGLLHSGVHCSTILKSARFAYDHTQANDSALRAHYLALIIRARHTFKRSGTLQREMEEGGQLFFDLFVAMSNHLDDMSQKSPR